MARKFILLATQRSGSTWVVDMLNAHPRVAAYSELFLAGGHDRPSWGGSRDVVFWEAYLRARREEGDGRDQHLLIRAYLDALFAPRASVDTVGFKLMYGQAGAYPEIESYLAENGAAVVHLIRRNSLDIIVSKYAAVQRNQFHARTDAAVAPVKVMLDLGELLDRLASQERETARYGARFSGAGLAYCEVFYEDLVDKPSGFANILRFLQVSQPDDTLASSLKKLVTRSHRELIENYDETRAVLTGTRYEGMLR